MAYRPPREVAGKLDGGLDMPISYRHHLGFRWVPAIRAGERRRILGPKPRSDGFLVGKGSHSNRYLD